MSLNTPYNPAISRGFRQNFWRYGSGTLAARRSPGLSVGDARPKDVPTQEYRRTPRINSSASAAGTRPTSIERNQSIVFCQPFAERHLRLPAELLLGQRDVGLAPRRVVGRQRLGGRASTSLPVSSITSSASSQDRELARVAEVHRADEIVRAVHHADDAFDQVVAVAERARLAAVAEDRDVLAARAPGG